LWPQGSFAAGQGILPQGSFAAGRGILPQGSFWGSFAQQLDSCMPELPGSKHYCAGSRVHTNSGNRQSGQTTPPPPMLSSIFFSFFYIFKSFINRHNRRTARLSTIGI